MKIKSLEDLKKWNKNPIGEIIILEWALDNFFENLIKDNIDYCKELRSEMIKSCEHTEKLSYEDSVKRVDGNFNYYSGRSITKWNPAWCKFKNEHIKRDDKIRGNMCTYHIIDNEQFKKLTEEE